MNNSTRLKVLIKSLTNEESFEKIFDSISADGSVRLTNLCKDSSFSTGHVVFLRWTNNIDDGPISLAHYFHLSLPSSVDRSVEFFNVTVLSSREISVRWKSNSRSALIARRIRWRISNKTKTDRTLIAGSNETQIILDELTPFTDYKVFLETFDIHGSAGQFESDFVRTEEDGSIDFLS